MAAGLGRIFQHGIDALLGRPRGRHPDPGGDYRPRQPCEPAPGLGMGRRSS